MLTILCGYVKQNSLQQILYIKAKDYNAINASVSYPADIKSWQKHVDETIEPYCLSGDHYSLLSSANVDKLAHIINEAS